MPSRLVRSRVGGPMSDTRARVLRTLRNPKLVNGIGLGLVALVGVWLVVNFVKGPQEFVNVALDGLTRGSIYGVVALGYTLVYGILQLINFAHGDVFSLSGPRREHDAPLGPGADRQLEQPCGDRRDRHHARDHHPAVRSGQRDNRARRLPAAPPRPSIDAADHSGRHVVHRLEHLACALRRRLRERVRADPPGRRLLDR